MTLNDLFNLVGESQKTVLIEKDGGLKISGTQDSLGAMLSDAVFSESVVDIEARADELWVWIEE